MVDYDYRLCIFEDFSYTIIIIIIIIIIDLKFEAILHCIHRHGFNILLHGLGSKRRLLEEFRKKMLPELVHIVINGFFPSLTIKSVSHVLTLCLIAESFVLHCRSEFYEIRETRGIAMANGRIGKRELEREEKLVTFTFLQQKK